VGAFRQRPAHSGNGHSRRQRIACRDRRAAANRIATATTERHRVSTQADDTRSASRGQIDSGNDSSADLRRATPCHLFRQPREREQ
jgi:hypothetical protein